MAGKKKDLSYNDLMASLKRGDVARCYIFHGEEHYLLMNALGKLRSIICPGGLDGFNYKRLTAGQGNAYSSEESSDEFVRELYEAVEMLPFCAEKTLIEIHEYDIFKSAKKEKISRIISDLPGHVCVVFIYTAIEYKPDGRLNVTKEIINHSNIVDFAPAEESDLIRWIIKHFNAAGKQISNADAGYLAELTGGLMSTLDGEIEKIASFAKDTQIKRSDIDAVAVPVVDAVAYRLSDAIIKSDSRLAMQLLEKLLQMREPAHKLMYNISLKMRQLLAARVCLDSKAGKTDFMKMCGIRHEYPAQILMNTANLATGEQCRNYVLMCAQTARELNSTSGAEEALLIELVTRLLHNKPA